MSGSDGAESSQQRALLRELLPMLLGRQQPICAVKARKLQVEGHVGAQIDETHAGEEERPSCDHRYLRLCWVIARLHGGVRVGVVPNQPARQHLELLPGRDPTVVPLTVAV